jgi:hypothetical protein
VENGRWFKEEEDEQSSKRRRLAIFRFDPCSFEILIIKPLV